MEDENSFYFTPVILSLQREVLDFYDESRLKDPVEEAAIKAESDCTKEFAKEIIFNRIQQMRINSIQALIDRQRCKRNPEGEGTMPIMPVEESASRRSSRTSRISRRSRTSRSSQSQNKVTETTTTTIVTTHDIQEGDLINFSDTSLSFEQKFLEETNKYREMHDSPPLTLNKEICAYAKEWANKCADSRTLDHRPDNIYGENILAAQGIAIDPALAVKTWYDENVNYSYDNPIFSPNTGHFTQLIWKSSKEVGVAIVIRESNIYVIANFNPPGNIENEFVDNVLPPIQ